MTEREASGAGRAMAWGAALVSATALGWAVLFAPFDVVGWHELDRLQNGQRRDEAPRVRAIAVAPIWRTPEPSAQQAALAKVRGDDASYGWEVERVDLATGRLAVLLAVALVAAVVARRQRV